MFRRLPSCKVTAPVVLLLSLVSLGLANAPRANGDTLGIETTQHGVVISSTLRHCPSEDGGQHLRRLGPCTWNVGPSVDGNGRGLAYIMSRQGHQRLADYVWATDPAVNGWHWSRVDNDCVVRAGHYRCPDGDHGTVGGIPAGGRW